MSLWAFAMGAFLQVSSGPILCAGEREAGRTPGALAPRVSDTTLALPSGHPGEGNAAGANLLRNPSFEAIPGNVQGAGILPSEWTIIAPSPDTYSTDGSYGLPPNAFGNFPGVIARNGIRWVAALGATTTEVFGQQLSSPLLPNQTYRITGWLHQSLRSDVAHPGTYELLLAMSPPTPQTAVVLGRLPPTTVPQWEPRSLVFTAPPDSTSRPWLVFRPVPTGTVPSTYPGLDTLDLQPCSTEICNGQDDDCDGSVDEGNPGGSVTCGTGLPGVCAVGTTQCQSGAIVCNQNTQPSVEVCNSLDDDCDGSIDDGNPGGGTTCSTGLPGVCTIGTTQCLSGAIVCNQNTQPSAELCNNLDDDCDGSIDEGNPGGGTTCSTGLQGACAAGTMTCLNGTIVCRQNTQPTAELCNDLDDDCDGQTDEGFGQVQFDPNAGMILVGIGGVCVFGSGLCEVPGTVQCNEDGIGVRCVPSPGEIPTPGAEGPYGNESCCNLEDDDCDGRYDQEDPQCQGPELCDGCDNDNDGDVDELWPTLGQPCAVGLGACAQPGVFQCATSDSVACSATALQPGVEGPPGRLHCEDGADNDCDGLTDIRDPGCQSSEICDKKDNNGNGQVDENFPLLGRPCVAGLGECRRDGFFDCTSDGTGVRCNAPPGRRRPEGVGCHCSDGLDNDCDSLIDEDDPDCGGSALRVQAALPTICRNPDGDCHSWHTIDWNTLNAGPELVETSELLALGEDGARLGSIVVRRGDTVRLTSRTPAAMAQWGTHVFMLDLDFFDDQMLSCLSGPGVAVSPDCARVDADCDFDIDLHDFAWLQNHLHETVTLHEMIAPRPVLRVVANDGFGKAAAYASPVPHVQVWSPDETVASLSEGDRVRVNVALANVNLATLELFIDGVSLFPAMGLIPGVAFPGGPYRGSVALPNNCVAEVCDLVVDAADLDTPAANTLTMYVENLCCGGHRFVARGAPRPGSYPDPIPPLCDPTDMADDGVSHGFEVTVLSPADGASGLASPTPVLGLACHGLPLESPIPAADRMVRLNGELFSMNPPSITPGDGVFTVDTYRYSFGGLLPRTDLFNDLILGNGVAGRLDPGGNKLIAEVMDPMLNTTYDVLHIGSGPTTPSPQEHVAVAGGGGSAIPHGFSVTVNADEFRTMVTESLESLAPPAVQAISNFLEGLRGTELVFPTDACDINLTVLDDRPVPYEFTMSPDDFSFQVTLLDDRVDLRATSGPIHAAGSVWGSCRIDLFGGCFIRVVVRAGAEIDIAAAEITLSVSENDLISRADLSPELVINEDDLSIHVTDVSSDVACWGGALLEILSFGALENLLSILVVDRVQEFLSDLDVGAMLDLLPVPPIPLNVLDFNPVNIATLNVNFDFGLTEVEISPAGIAVGFETEFTPTSIDPEVIELPGIPASIADLPLPVLPNPPASGLTALIADDAINQLFQALTRNGILKTQFENQRQIEDLLPADCGALPPGADGLCEALRGTTCSTIPNLVERAACAAASAILGTMNISGETTILLQGRIDVPPKFFAFQAAENVLTVYIRLSQAYVGIVADRDGDGEFTGDYTSLPSCLAGNLGTTTECAIWGACFDVTFTATLTLNVLPGGVATLSLDVTAADLSTATGCSGGTATAGGLNGLEAIFEGPVFALLQSYIDNNIPPLVVQGLDFGGIITLLELRPITYGNEFDPLFEDTFGLTADVTAGP